MGQAGAVIIADMRYKHLRFMHEPPERAGMQHTVAVTLENRPARTFRLSRQPPATGLRMRRINGIPAYRTGLWRLLSLLPGGSHGFLNTAFRHKAYVSHSAPEVTRE
jgi:hypothetical protein